MSLFMEQPCQKLFYEADKAAIHTRVEWKREERDGKKKKDGHTRPHFTVYVWGKKKNTWERPKWGNLLQVPFGKLRFAMTNCDVRYVEGEYKTVVTTQG